MAQKEHMVIDVVDMLRRMQNDCSIRAIGRARGTDHNTLRKYLRFPYEKGSTADGLIAGIEDARAFFGGLTEKAAIDNLKAAVVKSDRCAPIFDRTFLEYSAFRGFIMDPARSGNPAGKPKVEREVPYVRKNFFAGDGLQGSRPRPGRGYLPASFFAFSGLHCRWRCESDATNDICCLSSKKSSAFPRPYPKHQLASPENARFGP